MRWRAQQAAATRPVGLEATTLAEAFQLTAAANADQVAIRTQGDEFSATWAEYAAGVEKLARGLAGLGLGKGDTVGLMLTNRPDFHFFDTAALHLGATPFSIYNTYTAEQIEYLVGDAGHAHPDHREGVPDTVILAVRDKVPAIEHVIVVDGDGSDNTLTPGPTWRPRAIRSSTSRRHGRASSRTTSSR